MRPLRGCRGRSASRFLLAELDRHDRHPVGVFVGKPSRQRGHAAPARHHLQHDVGRLDRLVPPRHDAGRRQELVVDVEPVGFDRIGDQDLVGQLFGRHVIGVREPVRIGDHQHLLVVEHGVEAQARLVQRIGRHEHVDVIAEQGADAAELEALLHVHVDVGPARQVRRHDLQQPLVARMALHPDAQRAALALRVLLHPLLGELELRQQPVRQLQQILPALGEPQAAAFPIPDRRAELLLDFPDGVAECRLREVQCVGGRGQ